MTLLKFISVSIVDKSITFQHPSISRHLAVAGKEDQAEVTLRSNQSIEKLSQCRNGVSESSDVSSMAL
jgi:hypothetical protein